MARKVTETATVIPGDARDCVKAELACGHLSEDVWEEAGWGDLLDGATCPTCGASTTHSKRYLAEAKAEQAAFARGFREALDRGELHVWGVCE